MILPPQLLRLLPRRLRVGQQEPDQRAGHEALPGRGGPVVGPGPG